MGVHLLRHLSGITIALSNLTGVVVFYVSFSNAFEGLSISGPVLILSVVAIRLSFCILIHQAIASTGLFRYVLGTVVVLIALTPALRVAGPMPSSIMLQLALDVLIVLVAIAVRTPNQLSLNVNQNPTYIIPDQAIALDYVIKNYGVSELGSLYLYLPNPICKCDIKASAWIDILSASQLIKSCYNVDAHHATKAARRAQPHLFRRKIDRFDVYRLDLSKVKASASDIRPHRDVLSASDA